MIIIAHRLATIEAADQILVVDDGRIVEKKEAAFLRSFLVYIPKRRSGTVIKLSEIQCASGGFFTIVNGTVCKFI